jgi:hypothetical protein
MLLKSGIERARKYNARDVNAARSGLMEIVGHLRHRAKMAFSEIPTIVSELLAVI